MSSVVNQKRCGGCHFAKVVAQLVAHDLTKRICYGAPPSAHQVMLPGGKMSMQMVRPVVSVTEDACALWYPVEIREDEAEQVGKEAYSGMSLDIKQ
jgi:hypothetical protein